MKFSGQAVGRVLDQRFGSRAGLLMCPARRRDGGLHPARPRGRDGVRRGTTWAEHVLPRPGRPASLPHGAGARRARAPGHHAGVATADSRCAAGVPGPGHRRRADPLRAARLRPCRGAELRPLRRAGRAVGAGRAVVRDSEGPAQRASASGGQLARASRDVPAVGSSAESRHRVRQVRRQERQPARAADQFRRHRAADQGLPHRHARAVQHGEQGRGHGWLLPLPAPGAVPAEYDGHLLQTCFTRCQSSSAVHPRRRATTSS